MKKILHISNYYLPHIGGIEQVAYDIVSGLKGKYEQKVICFNDNKSTERDVYDGVEIIRVGTVAKVRSQSIALNYKTELSRLIEEFRPDIVHIHLPNPLITIYILQLKKLYEFKTVLHWHSDIIKQKFLIKLYRPIQDKLLEISDRIIATSPNYLECSEAINKYRNKAVFIPNVVDFKKFSLTNEDIEKIKEVKSKYNNEKILFFLGRHVEYKGIEYIIKASKYIDKNTRILIAGTGPLTETLKNSAKEIKNINFIGRLNDDELKQYLYASEVFLFPSITKNEAFGVALAEALYCKTPAVCFNIPGSGVSWVNQDKITGYVVENKDYRAFAESVNKLIYDEELNRELGENARKWVVNNMNKDILSTGVDNIYKSL